MVFVSTSLLTSIVPLLIGSTNPHIPVVWRVLYHIYTFRDIRIIIGNIKMPSVTPALAYLMPVYAVVSWCLLLSSSDRLSWAVPVSAFGAAWAVKNTIQRGRLDAGWISMGLVTLFSALKLDTQLPLMLSCLLTSANFAFPIIKWKSLTRTFDKGNLSSLWRTLFFYYCAAMGLLYLYGFYEIANIKRFTI